jgi:hypothetical protein
VVLAKQRTLKDKNNANNPKQTIESQEQDEVTNPLSHYASIRCFTTDIR